MMMHVAGLMAFEPPRDWSPDAMRHLMDDLRRHARVEAPWNLKLRTPDLLWNPLQQWIEEPAIDVEYHVRRTALPSPGDERELGIVVSRLHGNPIDLHRPPWEVHLIEGLSDGRFAMYVKVHHALVDGYTAMRQMVNALTEDRDDRRRALFFAVPPPARPPRDDDERTPLHFSEMLAAVRAQYGATKTVARALLDVVRRDDLVTPRQAPMCILNKRISRSR